MKTDVLKTPLVEIWIEDENRNHILFDIVPNTCSDHTVYLNNDENQKIEVTDYEDCRIRLETKDLEIKKNYYIRSSEPLEPFDSDEWLFTRGITKGYKTLAISFPEPNDEYKTRQLINNNDLNEDDMEGYHLSVIGNTGDIILRVLDRKFRQIFFPVAWIWNISSNMDDYETAAACMTWDGLSWNDIFGQKTE